MGKGDRKTKPKKHKLPALAAVPRPKARGRKRMAHVKADPDAERTVLTARARQSGKEPGEDGEMKPADLAEMRHPAYGEPAGRAIYASVKGDDAKRLWEAYAGLTAAEAAYAKAYLGMRFHAKTAKVEYLIEVFEARPDDRPDLRTEDERSRDAANNWMRWRGYLMHLPRAQQDIIRDVAHGDVEPMDAGEITAQGRRFIAAVTALAAVVDRPGGTR